MTRRTHATFLRTKKTLPERKQEYAIKHGAEAAQHWYRGYLKGREHINKLNYHRGWKAALLTEAQKRERTDENS